MEFESCGRVLERSRNSRGWFIFVFFQSVLQYHPGRAAVVASLTCCVTAESVLITTVAMISALVDYVGKAVLTYDCVDLTMIKIVEFMMMRHKRMHLFQCAREIFAEMMKTGGSFWTLPVQLWDISLCISKLILGSSKI
jgi:hypothetical protein